MPVLPRARESFEPAEFEQVQLAAERSFRAALRRIEPNVTHLERFTAGEFAVGSQVLSAVENRDPLATQDAHVR